MWISLPTSLDADPDETNERVWARSNTDIPDERRPTRMGEVRGNGPVRCRFSQRMLQYCTNLPRLPCLRNVLLHPRAFERSPEPFTWRSQSQGVEVHQLSDDTPPPETDDRPAGRRQPKRKPASKRQNQKRAGVEKDKAPVDPCKYKTKLCRTWMRDGMSSG